VLILSGNRFTAQLVRQLFFGLGMRDIAVAPDPAEACERLSISRLDLVVADTGPATYDPLASLLCLRGLADERQSHIPIILLTAANLVLSRSISMLDGAAQITKPLSNKPFADAVLRCLLHIDGVEEISPFAAQEPDGRKTTLILSANPYTIQVVRGLLLPLGLSDVAVAKDALEAEQKVAQTHFDFVVADHGLAAFDTLDFIETHKQVARTLCETPVLLLSADLSERLASRALKAQVRAIVAKPIDAEGFVRRVARVLEVGR
jgi:two-component system chemotaxis response regulator CheY